MNDLQRYLDTYARKILLNKKFSSLSKLVMGKKSDTALLSIFNRSINNGRWDIAGFSYKHQIFFHLFFRPWKDTISLEKQI